ncbi:hypothetical protein CRN52_13995 [Vibrio vulnificus]|uniref:Uncharacterized protein n=1 Tax=Vibrio vulnificus TaxID=672 RepID=A0A2S3R257_VIBVL|nr:hypothetical protein CRN52_13995 [Vibrio vulnificus]
MLFVHIWLPISIILAGAVATYYGYHFSTKSEWVSKKWTDKYLLMTQSVVAASMLSTDYEQFILESGMSPIFVNVFSFAVVTTWIFTVPIIVVGLYVIISTEPKRD